MGRFFNLDNPFFVFMGKVADLFLLNLVFMLCCIPIVTIGPAFTAMFYVTLKMVKNEEAYIFRSFFHSFRQNLKQGIIIHLILSFFGILLVGDFFIIRNMENAGTMSDVMRVLLLVVFIFLYLEYLYVYPVLSKFDNTIKNTMRNAFFMSIRHLPQTAIIFVISLLPLAVLLIKDVQFQSSMLFMFALLGPTCVAYGTSIFFSKVFATYIPEEVPEYEPDVTSPEFGVYEAVTPQSAEQDVYAKFRNMSDAPAGEEVPAIEADAEETSNNGEND
ncbi:MAG: YesL family protein [Clostridiales bacterium]|nr:YesL family protein [Candidatus Blautia equi]